MDVLESETRISIRTHGPERRYKRGEVFREPAFTCQVNQVFPVPDGGERREEVSLL